ncbi:LPXTG cell wall anchor domain-containing protein [Alkalihalobacterium alkalinitrilicum]|uniref:LPXTG cell wall anchor domain-containing protein n=1 Tax=Alkalihalobacterium alkalinitrilicum TaxID=427920 RepID=UPI00114EFC8F|nr:LPXTG cell wall anchor domain-containing protein [Alkalihalobacterium alkalinitrilicum]
MKNFSFKPLIYFIVLFAMFLPSSALAATYTYDELNRITSVTYNDGQTIEYTYDSTGNILSVTQNGGAPTEETPPQEETPPGESTPPGEIPTPEEDTPPNESTPPEEPTQPEAGGNPQDETVSEEDVRIGGGNNENDQEVREEVEEGKEVAGEDHGLPKTATSMFNWIFVGIILLGAGIATIVIVKRRQNLTE